MIIENKERFADAIQILKDALKDIPPENVAQREDFEAIIANLTRVLMESE